MRKQSFLPALAQNNGRPTSVIPRSLGSSARLHLPFSPISLSVTVVIVLLVAYIGLIAMVMSYAALTVEFSQSVRNDESAVAQLESDYLARVARITTADYKALGYAKPATELFVRAESATALR